MPRCLRSSLVLDWSPYKCGPYTRGKLRNSAGAAAAAVSIREGVLVGRIAQ